MSPSRINKKASHFSALRTAERTVLRRKTLYRKISAHHKFRKSSSP